jgi:type IV pilus assembly protein PilW
MMQAFRLMSRERGFSMVELMVAVTLGLIVTAVVSQVFVASKTSYRSEDNSSRLQENSRFATQLLTRELRMARYKGLNQEAFTNVFPVGISPLAGLDNSAATQNNSDQITVAFFGSGDGAGTADGTVANCAGVAIDSSVITQDSFFVAPDPGNISSQTGAAIPSLYCTSTLTPAIAGVPNPQTLSIVQGVESLQFLYGIDSDLSGNPNQWVHAGIINAGGSATMIMDNVVAIRFSMLMRGEELVGTTSAGRNDSFQQGNQFYHFGIIYNGVAANDPGAVSTIAADGRARALFSTTVALRNPSS